MVKKSDNLPVHWWGLTLRGIAAILFGAAAIFWPGLTLVTLVYLLSSFVLVAGLVSVVEGVVAIGQHRAWVLTLLLGLVEVAVGVYLLRHPAVTFATFILVVGLLFIARGVFEVVVALAEDGVNATSRMLQVLVGVAAFLLGVLLLFQPEASGVAFVWLLGVYALVTGPLMIAMSIDVKKALDQ